MLRREACYVREGVGEEVVNGQRFVDVCFSAIVCLETVLRGRRGFSRGSRMVVQADARRGIELAEPWSSLSIYFF